MGSNLCKNVVLLFILLSIFFFSSLHGSSSLDPNVSASLADRNTTMKLARRLRGGAGVGAVRGRGGIGTGRVIPLHGSGVGHEIHRRSAATRSSCSSVASVLVAAFGAAILSTVY